MATPRAWSHWRFGIFVLIAAAATLFLLRQTPLNDLAYSSMPGATKPNRWPSTSSQVSARSFISAGETLDVAIWSPNGRFRFSLEQTGQLVLEDLQDGRRLFDTDTNIGWPVTWRAALTTAAELRLTWAHPTAKPYKGEPWVSSLLPNCTTAGARGIANSDAEPVLELLDSGKLHIRVGTETTCVLHRAIDDRGRLAIVYPGLLRTFDKTCEEHRQKIVDRWPGSGGADVHVLAYHEEAWLPHGEKATEESLTNRLRECFGDHLKTVQIRHLSDTEESWHELPASLAHVCLKDKLKRQLSQFKSTYLVAQQLRRYMMQQAVQYDYILKLRMDLTLWGDIPDLDPSLIPRDGIVAPRIALDWVFYSLVHDGSLRQGVSDIAAFGRSAAMFTYLDLYRELVWLRETEKDIARYKAVNTHFHAKEQVPDAEHCTPENILAYWLELSGVPVATDWRWQMALLRGDGSKKFTCPHNQRLWNCPGFVP